MTSMTYKKEQNSGREGEKPKSITGRRLQELHQILNFFSQFVNGFIAWLKLREQGEASPFTTKQ